tara:strand:+ start:176 stop:514 length:339 start_codon:yes stop_codon:yes gene_type:complete
MTRLIDTMTGAEVRGRLSPFFDGICCYEDRDAWLTEELENLFAKEPCWSDNLDPKDDQTWVFCFISDDSREDTSIAQWIARVTCAGYRCRNGCAWKYATPVNLNVRYKEGDD